MILTSLIIIIFLIFAGYFKAKMDYYEESGIKNKEWKNKWLLHPTDGKPILSRSKSIWYLRLYKTRYIERFPYSSTILVMFTDSWHNAQFCFLRFISAAIATLYCELVNLNICWFFVITFIIIPSIIGIIFQLIHTKLKSK